MYIGGNAQWHFLSLNVPSTIGSGGSSLYKCLHVQRNLDKTLSSLAVKPEGAVYPVNNVGPADQQTGTHDQRAQ